MTHQFVLGSSDLWFPAGAWKEHKKTLERIVWLIPSAAVMGKTECQCPLEVSFIAVRSVNILLTPPTPTLQHNLTVKLLYNIYNIILSYISIILHWISSVMLTTHYPGQGHHGPLTSLLISFVAFG